jgi:hypothetical protein
MLDDRHEPYFNLWTKTFPSIIPYVTELPCLLRKRIYLNIEQILMHISNKLCLDRNHPRNEYMDRIDWAHSLYRKAPNMDASSRFFQGLSLPQFSPPSPPSAINEHHERLPISRAGMVAGRLPIPPP